MKPRFFLFLKSIHCFLVIFVILVKSSLPNDGQDLPDKKEEQRRGSKQQAQIFKTNQNQQRWLPQQTDVEAVTWEPVNAPTVDQRQAAYLEKYLRNYFGDLDNKQQLANSNNRAALLSAQKPSNQNLIKPIPLSNYAQRESQIQTREDTNLERLSPGSRKGKVDDVVLFNTDGGLLNYHKPSGRLENYKTNSAHQFNVDQHQQLGLIKPGLFANKLMDNCITRSEGIVSRCEDHLIKRLNQDAGEGRTALDVERRVCCALFWHKDCVNRVMVETCPDSSPAAADRLMGSRKIDLTLSCKNFNRDGCNGSHGLVVSSINYLIIISLILSILIF